MSADCPLWRSSARQPSAQNSSSALPHTAGSVRRRGTSRFGCASRCCESVAVSECSCESDVDSVVSYVDPDRFRIRALRRRVRRLQHDLPVPVSRTSSSAPQWTLVRFLKSTETSGKANFAESLGLPGQAPRCRHSAHGPRRRDFVLPAGPAASRPFVERCADRPRPG